MDVDPTAETVRYYVVLKPRPEVVENYFHKDPVAAENWLRTYVAEHVGGVSIAHPPFKIVGRPSQDISLEALKEKLVEAARSSQDLVLALEIEDFLAIDKLVSAARDEKNIEIFAGSSPDLPFSATDHWCPGHAADPVFGDRADADRVLGAGVLRQKGLTGTGVNVVVVDQGLDAGMLGSHYGGGWQVGNSMPGVGGRPDSNTLGRSHGMMVAHNIQKLAPDVTFWDMPLVKVRITKIPVFLSSADAAFRKMFADIKIYRQAKPNESWILVNPWGIYDKKTEYPPGSYTDNPDNPFNKLVRQAVQDDIDVVFSAGNCGQFCPSERCAQNVIGPGRSILGAASLPQVLTVGAVRCDTMWLGYSAQGPGQPNMNASEKPDLCAPSQFCETDDAFSLNTGTSAAGALAGGVMAALRSKWRTNTVPPGQLKDILIATAWKVQGNSWNNRLGHGVLNAAGAVAELEKLTASSRSSPSSAAPGWRLAKAGRSGRGQATGGRRSRTGSR